MPSPGRSDEGRRDQLNNKPYACEADARAARDEARDEVAALLGCSDNDPRITWRVVQDFADVFGSGVDLLFTPTTPTPAFPLGAKTTDPYEMYLNDIFTVTANLAGIPAMSLPIGRVDGLPVGGQLMAPHFHEFEMFSAAFALERALVRVEVPLVGACEAGVRVLGAGAAIQIVGLLAHRFFGRVGGTSPHPWAALNTSFDVSDAPARVEENLARIRFQIGVPAGVVAIAIERAQFLNERKATVLAMRAIRKVRPDAFAPARKILISKKAYSVQPGATKKVVLTVRKPARKPAANACIRRSSNTPSQRATTAVAMQLPITFTAVRPMSRT